MAESKVYDPNKSTVGGTPITGHSGAMQFRRSGRTVNAYLNGDWTSLESGKFVTVGQIPEGYRPLATMRTPECSLTGNTVLMLLDNTGNIRVYNYGSTITSAKNGNYNITYIV